jgi:hypothetical protein
MVEFQDHIKAIDVTGREHVPIRQPAHKQTRLFLEILHICPKPVLAIHHMWFCWSKRHHLDENVV